MPPSLDLSSAVERAVRFLADCREPHALLWLEHMHRHFAIPEFGGSLARFDRMLAEKPHDAAKLRLFRRIADPGNRLRLEDLESLSHPSDGIIVSALYCDRLVLPPSFPGLLGSALEAGGYYCTHALLAWVWIREYGDRLDLPPTVADQLLAANAAIVNRDTSTVTDLKLEAAAFLYLAGAGARVDPAFVDTVLKTQNADGGWGMTRARPGVSDWHGTVLGLMLLLHVRDVRHG